MAVKRPDATPKDIIELQNTYKSSQIRLIQIIEQQEARGNVTEYRKALLSNVREELRILDNYAIRWVTGAIPRAAETGLKVSFEEFRRAMIRPPRIQANSRTIQILAQSCVDQLTTATAYVGRKISDDIRKAGIEAVSSKVATGSTVKEAKRLLLDKLSDAGIPAIKDKRGREIQLDVYAKMVARTTTREATNRAAIDAVLEVEEDLVQCTQHFSTCPICAVYENRVYSISGNSTEYPALNQVPGFKDGFSTIHPNCGHVFVPYFPEYDDEADETKKQSNRPFVLDKDAERKVARYNAAQGKNIDRADDRRQYADLMKYLPPDQRPTFSGFRAMKRANSAKYKDLLDAKKAALTGAVRAAATPAAAAAVHPIANGAKNLNIGPWDSYHYKFEIQQILHEQGYDGKPRVVSKAEFNRLLDTSKQPFLSRTYSAETQDVLDEYARQLRDGEFYVDCSVGGSQYGKGMYAAGAYSDDAIPKALAEMQDYIQLNRERGRNISKIEHMTLDPSAKIIKYLDIDKQYGDEIVNNITEYIGSNTKFNSLVKDYLGCQDEIKAVQKQNISYDAMHKKTHAIKLKQEKIDDKLYLEDNNAYDKFMNAIDKDKGTKAAELGYDAINAEGHGRSDSYTVVLNRTKLIIQGG